MGKVDLDEIVKMLDERVIAMKIGLKHVVSLRDYNLKKLVVADYTELMDETTKFYQYQMARTRHGGVVMSEWVAHNSVRKLLESAFGQMGGLEGAFDIASNGTEDAMMTVIRVIYEAIKKEDEEAYIEWILRTYVNPLNPGERIEVMAQYLERFGRYLPPGTRVKSPQELSVKYDEVIKLHMKALQAIRGRIGR